MRGAIFCLGLLLLAGCLQNAADVPVPEASPDDERTEAVSMATAESTRAPEPEEPHLYSDWFVRALHDPQGAGEVVLVSHAPEGYQPLDHALDAVALELARALQKPVTWQRQMLDVAGGADTRWTGTQLGVMAMELRATPWPEGTIMMHAVSLPGCYTVASRPCVGGVEVGSVAFVFLDEKRDATSIEALRDEPYLGERSIQRYILLHELGHAIGLVAAPVPAINTARIADDGCGCHSTNEHSVMRGRGGTSLTGDHGHDLQEIQDLLADERWNHVYDEDDIADLRAFQDALR